MPPTSCLHSNSGLDFFPKSLNFNCAFNISTCLSDETFKTWYAEKKHWFSSQLCYFLVLPILISAKSIFMFHLNQNCWSTFKYCFLHPIPLLVFFFKLSTFCFLPKDFLLSDISMPCSNVSFMTVPKQKMTSLSLSFLFLQVSPCMFLTAPELFISPSLSISIGKQIPQKQRHFTLPFYPRCNSIWHILITLYNYLIIFIAWINFIRD